MPGSEVTLSASSLEVEDQSRVVISDPKGAALLEWVLNQTAHVGGEEGNFTLGHNGAVCKCTP